MAKVVFDGKYKVYLADTVADLDAPTLSEITGATDITDDCPKDFLQWGKNQGRVDGGSIATLFAAESMGTWTLGGSMSIFLDDATTPVWDVIDLLAHKTLIILPFGGGGAEGAPDDGDHAYCSELEFGMPTPTNPAENQRQRAEVDFAVQSEPSFNATVVSGS